MLTCTVADSGNGVWPWSRVGLLSRLCVKKILTLISHQFCETVFQGEVSDVAEATGVHL